jgi:hypothetical protein
MAAYDEFVSSRLRTSKPHMNDERTVLRDDLYNVYQSECPRNQDVSRGVYG